MQGIGQEIPAITPALLPSIDGQASEQRRRNARIARQFANGLGRPFTDIYRSRRKRVVAGDSSIRQDQHERRRNVLTGILSSLQSKISIERFYATFE